MAKQIDKIADVWTVYFLFYRTFLKHVSIDFSNDLH